MARGTEREGRPERGRWPERDGQSESRREGEGEGMTTTSCSQAKREGGEQHGQCEFKDSERRKKTYKYPRKAPELAWDLGVRAIAIKSKRSGWPFERQGGNTTRLRKKII